MAINYEEDWAKSKVTHVSSAGGGVNHYTGLKTTPSDRILKARRKLIDEVYRLNNLQIALVNNNPTIVFPDLVMMWATMGKDPYKWNYPPQFLDRHDLKTLIANMKQDIKYTQGFIRYEKQKRKTSRKQKRKTSRKQKRKTSRKPKRKTSRKPKRKASRKPKRKASRKPN